MKKLLLPIFLMSCLVFTAQKKEKKPWFYGVIEYRDDLHISQCEVSYSDWFAFLYDKYLEEDMVSFEHLIPPIKKSESRMLWDFFLRNWSENEDFVRVKIKSAISRYEIWLNKDGTIEMFNLKKYLEFPITGLTKNQVNAYLEWMYNMQSEIYLDGYENYQITLGLPDINLAKELTEGARRGDVAIGDSVNIKGCQLFNFHSDVPCEGSEDRQKLYGNINGMVSKTDFFPDKNGLYNILGNVSEMTSEPNTAFGGNYNQYASEILSAPTQSYNEPDTLVGFRYIIRLTKN